MKIIKKKENKSRIMIQINQRWISVQMIQSHQKLWTHKNINKTSKRGRIIQEL